MARLLNYKTKSSLYRNGWMMLTTPFATTKCRRGIQSIAMCDYFRKWMFYRKGFAQLWTARWKFRLVITGRLILTLTTDDFGYLPYCPFRITPVFKDYLPRNASYRRKALVLLVMNTDVYFWGRICSIYCTSQERFRHETPFHNETLLQFSLKYGCYISFLLQGLTQ